MLARTPRWARLLAALLLIGAGVYLLPRPLAAMSTLALGGAACALLWAVQSFRTAAPGRVLIAACALLITANVLLFPSELGRALPVLVPVGLFGYALVRLLRLLMSAAPVARRLAALLWVVAAAVTVPVALRWPDAALVLIAVATSLAAIVSGCVLAIRSLRRRHVGAARHDSPRARAAAVSFAVVGVMVAAGLAWGSVWLGSDRAEVSDFYRWEGGVPPKPGTLVAQEPYDGDLPDGATAVRILYTTTHADGTPTLASGVVALPEHPDGTALAWQHGTTGVARQCAPSVTPDALIPYAIPGIAEAMQRGWSVVATDYPGQGTEGRYPYLVGEGEGRATLDAIRAAQQLDAATTFERVELWGHSQGGHATLWAADLAQSYAPELPVESVAALSAASDPLALAEAITSGPESAMTDLITSYVLAPYAQEYSDIDLQRLVHPAGYALVDAMTDRCVLEKGTLISILTTTLSTWDQPLFTLDLAAGPERERLLQNVPPVGFDAPLFLGQGVDDEVIPIRIQRELADRVCDGSRSIVVHEYPGRSHMGAIAEDSPLIPDLFDWLDGIREGRAPTPCDADAS